MDNTPEQSENGPLWMSSKPDDDELARAIAETWVSGVCFLYGQWHRYEGGCWRIRAPQQMQMGLREMLRQFRRQQQQIEITISQARVSGLSRMLEQDLFMPDEDFNQMMPEQERYISSLHALLVTSCA